jgi:hypothetical protein
MAALGLVLFAFLVISLYGAPLLRRRRRAAATPAPRLRLVAPPQHAADDDSYARRAADWYDFSSNDVTQPAIPRLRRIDTARPSE